jgi:uncharacterized membrane protein YfcA
MPLAAHLALCGIVCAALLVEASLGFGATVVVVALGAFLYPIEQLLPAYVPVNMVLSTYMVVRHWDAIDGRLLLRRVLPFMALGLPFGLFLFRFSGGPLLKTLFGVFVVVLATLELVRLARTGRVNGAAAVRPLPAAAAGIFLVLGGLVHGAFGTGGPMAVYVAGREIADKRVFRSTLSALWLLLNAALLATYAASGFLSLASARLSATLLVPLAVGIAAGEWAHRRLPHRAFATLVFAVLLVAGLVLALKAR